MKTGLSRVFLLACFIGNSALAWAGPNDLSAYDSFVVTYDGGDVPKGEVRWSLPTRVELRPDGRVKIEFLRKFDPIEYQLTPKQLFEVKLMTEEAFKFESRVAPECDGSRSVPSSGLPETNYFWENGSKSTVYWSRCIEAHGVESLQELTFALVSLSLISQSH